MKEKGAERIDRDAQKREAERLAREREAIEEMACYDAQQADAKEDGKEE